MNILAIGAHPDDIEYGCGGLLLKYSKKKHNIFILVLTKGGMGGDTEIRVKEQQQVAELLNVKKIFWGPFFDTKLPRGMETIEFIESVIREVNPDEVYVNYKDDTHQDHKVLANCVLAATRYVKNVIFYEDYTSVDFVPDIFVDIEDVIEEKINLLKLFESQISKPHPGNLDFLESVKAIANYRGFQSRVKYAEGYKSFRIMKEI